MSIIEILHDYIGGYEPLQDDRLNVDFLPADAGSYSLDAVPCKEWVRRYIDGSGEKQFLFNLCSREAMDETLRRQMDSLGRPWPVRCLTWARVGRHAGWNAPVPAMYSSRGQTPQNTKFNVN